MARLQTRRDAITEEMAELERELDGLRRAAERHGLGLRNSPQRMLKMNRTDAVETVLRTTSGPVSPNDIVRLLNNLGRDDEYNAVSAALAHLARTGRAHTVERGSWQAGPGPDDAHHDEPSGDAVSASEPSARNEAPDIPKGVAE